jgi:hypothetical protein
MPARSLREYVNHYHRERNHQGIGNRLITPMTTRHHLGQATPDPSPFDPDTYHH